MIWYDIEKIYDTIYGHLWILRSDVEITREQHKNWLIESLKQREEISEENGEEEW